MSDMGASNIVPTLNSAQNKLNEAKSIVYQAASKIDEARKILNMLQGVLDAKKIGPLLQLMQNLESNAHQGWTGQITAMQAAIEQSK